MARILPGVYSNVQDISSLPESASSLAVGIVVQTNKGTIGAATLQSNAQDFLSSYLFSGVPSPSDDKSVFTALNILKESNQLYVVRAAKNALFGGVVVKQGLQPLPFNLDKISDITGVSIADRTFSMLGDKTTRLPQGDKLTIDGSTSNDGIYTIIASSYDIPTTTTTVQVVEAPLDNTADGSIFRGSIVDPVSFAFDSADLMIITGKDQGSYNGNISISIAQSTSEPNASVLTVINALTNRTLETFLFSRDMAAKSTDGTNLYIEDAVIGSNYIRVVNNLSIPSSVMPIATTSNVRLSGGFDGSTLTDSDLVGALSIFEDKVIPISILANGSIESATYQQAMIALAEQRQDIFAFLNSRLQDEKATTNSQKASSIVEYKKNTLTSTSFYAAMYAPHITTPDPYNSRNIVIGADAKAIPGWLNVVRTQGYPFANAGYRYGKIQGATCNWKIGDASGEGVTLNDASVNFIAFDPIQGSYLFWTQNTLQIANSAMRDIGVVLNVLDIKQTLAVALKEYIQLPITDDLREEINFTATNYMDGVKASNRVSDYAWQDVSTDTDISNDTLRFVLVIAPTKYAQQIYLTLDIVNQTYNFKILQSI